MGRLLFLIALLSAALGLVARDYNHDSLSAVLLCGAVLFAVFGFIFNKYHPLADLLEGLRRHAD